ncbi:MAG: hypothetical protein AAFY71_11605 [Bacteroidota bacterium]
MRAGKICSGLLALSLLALSACYYPQEGALSEEARTELAIYAGKSVSIQKKYIKLMDVMALLLKEGLEIGDNDVAMDHLRTFYHNNTTALKQISHEFNGWYRYSTSQERSDFFKAINEQPSAAQLKWMVPQFRNRISYNLDWENEYNILVGFLDIHR